MIKRKPRPKKPDPAANMFAIGVTADGSERTIACVNTIENLRTLIIENMKAGIFTEVAILNVRQLEPIVKRAIG